MKIDLTIKSKLRAGFGLLVLFVIIISIVALVSISRIFTNIDAVNQMNGYETFMLRKNIDHLNWMEKLSEAIMNTTKKSTNIQLDHTKCSLGIFIIGAEGKLFSQLDPRFQPLLKAISDPHQRLHNSAKKIDTILASGSDRKEAIKIQREETAKAVMDVQAILKQITDLTQQKKNTANEGMNSTHMAVRITTIIILLIAVVFGVMMSIVIIRGISLKLDRTISIMKASSEGNFTQRLNFSSKDEIAVMGECFNKHLDAMSTLIHNVKQSAESVSDSTTQLYSGSEELATGSNTQASSITETSAALEQFAGSIRESSTNSNDIKTALETFNNEVNEKRELVKNVTTTMDEIDQSGEQINRIISVINDISFQTNLLALNASVEAARAGEAGRGFAVVASEVRNLAEKTAESSKTIQEIVAKNVDSTKKGLDLVTKMSEFFGQIRTTMEGLVGKVQLISQSSSQQAETIIQINESISQLETVVNQNAAFVDELSGTGKNLSDNSTQLYQFVSAFTT